MKGRLTLQALNYPFDEVCIVASTTPFIAPTDQTIDPLGIPDDSVKPETTDPRAVNIWKFLTSVQVLLNFGFERQCSPWADSMKACSELI